MQFTAGRVSMDVWSDGWPIWCHLAVGEQRYTGMAKGELLDLQYVVQRALAHIAEKEEEDRRRRSSDSR